MTTSHRIRPVIKTRVVPIGLEQAFGLFTERAGGWERFDAEEEELRESYEQGWDVVLACLETFTR